MCTYIYIYWYREREGKIDREREKQRVRGCICVSVCLHLCLRLRVFSCVIRFMCEREKSERFDTDPAIKQSIRSWISRSALGET